jgi:L,D-peptidoglycan transpeptidase YkuD (ErfK/YbiS/YcfS/YnhG family)
MARRLKKKYRIALISFVVLIPLTIAGIFYWGTPEPPDQELDKANSAIAIAKNTIAPDFIPQALRDAVVLYDSAMVFWRTENEKFILKRDYSKVRTLAIRAEQLALASPKIATQNSVGFLAAIESDIEKAKRDTAQIEQLYSRLPLPTSINKKYSQGLLLLNEAIQNLEQKNYKVCRTKLESAKANLSDVARHTQNLLTDYFANLSMWKRWVDQTIKESAQDQSVAIVVDKFAGKCYLYKNGSLKKTYDVELGKNWIGEKKYSGDKATPEGKYKITKKKDGRQTKYSLALLVNYPNDEDKRRFQEGIRNKTIHRNAKIGGLIEIHGGGGKGVNWTDGCVALDNDQMADLYRQVSVGTAVTIVGSLQPLTEVIKRPKP